MTALELLRAGRERIARGWCQEDYAQDDQGAPALPWGSKACRWCASGALEFGDSSDDCRQEAWEALSAEIPGVSVRVTDFNDFMGRTQVEVLALYDRAIAALEARPEHLAKLVDQMLAGDL